MSTSRLDGVVFQRAYYGVKAIQTHVEMERCRFLNVREPYSGHKAHAWFKSCEAAFLNYQARGNVNLFKFTKGTAVVEGCDIHCPPTDYKVDAFDVDHVTSAVFRRNKIYGTTCEGADGIDVGAGSRQVLIADTLIADFADKGISVGEGARVLATNNVITRCSIGVGVKDRGWADIRSCTFFETDVGVACYEKIPGAGGGSGRVLSSVFSRIHNSEVTVDALSSLELSKCVSDKSQVPGRGNRMGKVQLEDPGRERFDVASFVVVGNAKNRANLKEDGFPAGVGGRLPINTNDRH